MGAQKMQEFRGTTNTGEQWRLSACASRAHQGGHATTRFLEGFLEGSLTAIAS